MDIKDLAENILSDIMNNGSISDILLKTKIFASKKGDRELLEWISNELGGYVNVKPPKYRILPSGLKVDVFVPFRGTSSIDFPAEMIKNKEVRERLSYLSFNNPITEIEGLCKGTKDDANLYAKVHAYAYQFMSEFINGEIQGASQIVTKASVSQILVAVKTVIIDFMLKISNDENIDFNGFINSDPKMRSNITINAAIVNTGSGDVNAQASTVVIGNNNNVNSENRDKLLEILDEIDRIADSDSSDVEYKEVVDDIRTELEKDNPSKNYLKRCFQAIPSFVSNVGAGIVANNLPTLISSALELIKNL